MFNFFYQISVVIYAAFVKNLGYGQIGVAKHFLELVELDVLVVVVGRHSRVLLKQPSIVISAHVNNIRQLIYVKILFPVVVYVFFSFGNLFSVLVSSGSDKNKHNE